MKNLRLLLLMWSCPLLSQQITSDVNKYVSPTGEQRLEWIAISTVGPASLAGGLVSAGLGTWTNQPKEYGTHWLGFGERYGMRLTGLSVGNTMEASLGAVWGEDPRYWREPDKPLIHRVGHVFKLSVLAYNREGREMPAYARYIGIVGNNYLSNTWRADSEATVQRATIRIGLGFLGKVSGNAWDEFWPDVKRRVFHSK